MALDIRGLRQVIPDTLRKIIGTGENSRALGDAARDREDWGEAASLYRLHLETCPYDAAIWIQLGHALKESHHRDEAETAYRTALSLTPNDGDLHLQLGHLLRLLGRTEEATESYKTAARLQPTSQAVAEPAGLMSTHGADRQRPAAKPVVGRVHVPVDDLFDYIHHHRTVSGIQRVQLNLIGYLIMLPNAGDRYGFMFSGQKRELRLVKMDQMAELAGAFGDPDVDHDTIRRMIVAAKKTSRPVSLRALDTCFIVGSFWNPGGNPDLLSQIKQSKASLGIYFHDLIPVTHREYVVSELSASFAQALVEALSVVDFAFANSEYTTKAVSQFVIREGLRSFPIRPIRLAHAQTLYTAGNDADVDWSELRG